MERDAKVPLYQGTPDDIHLAVVSAGSSHSASISRRGELYTWGLASSGELGHGGWTPIEVNVPRMITSLQRTRIVSVACGANHTLAISETGQLWSCGRGRHGQVRRGLHAAQCRAWQPSHPTPPSPPPNPPCPAPCPPRPSPPQLGHGHFHDEGVLLLVETIRHERIVSVAAGRAHSVALAADGKIFTWGDASKGQLGHAQLAAVMQVRCAAAGDALHCNLPRWWAPLPPAPRSSPPRPPTLPLTPRAQPTPPCRAPTRSRCPSPSRKPSSRWSR